MVSEEECGIVGRRVILLDGKKTQMLKILASQQEWGHFTLLVHLEQFQCGVPSMIVAKVGMFGHVTHSSAASHC